LGDKKKYLTMNLKVKNALISVSDKENLILILKTLKKFNIKIISSGGTYAPLKNLVMNVPNYQVIQVLKKCLMVE